MERAGDRHSKASVRQIRVHPPHDRILVAGLIIGLLARLILPGRQKIGLLWTLVLGVIGSVIGGTIANALNSGDIFELNFIGFIAAVVTSVALLAVAERSGLGSGEKRHVGPGRA